MPTIKIFKSDDSKMIKSPKNLVKVFELFSQLSADFFAEARQDLPPQNRDS